MRLLTKVLFAAGVALLTSPFANAAFIVSIDDRGESPFVTINGDLARFTEPGSILVSVGPILCPCSLTNVRFIVLEPGSTPTAPIVSDIISLTVSVDPSTSSEFDLSLTFRSDAETPLSYTPTSIDIFMTETGAFQTIYSAGNADVGLFVRFASDAAVPEPGTLALLGLGLAGLGFARRRR